MTVIGLVGDYDPDVTAHRAIPLALELAATDAGAATEWLWLATDRIGDEIWSLVERCNGLWCVPASPYRKMAGALKAIRYARESSIPFLGTCGGFQHAVLEYARNVLGHTEAAHGEVDPGAPHPLIAPLACSLVEQTGKIELAESSRVRAIYGVDTAEETYHCSYGIDRQHEELIAGGSLVISGRDAAGEVRAVELPGHPFFIATLFQPERAALKGEPHPLITAFVRAAAGQGQV